MKKRKIALSVFEMIFVAAIPCALIVWNYSTWGAGTAAFKISVTGILLLVVAFFVLKTIYLNKWLRRVAENSAAHAHYLAGKLASVPGFALRHKGREFFHEFLTDCPVDAEALCAKLAERGILGGLPVDGGLLWCCTELCSKSDMDELVTAIREVCAQ